MGELQELASNSDIRDNLVECFVGDVVLGKKSLVKVEGILDPC